MLYDKAFWQASEPVCARRDEKTFGSLPITLLENGISAFSAGFAIFLHF